MLRDVMLLMNAIICAQHDPDALVLLSLLLLLCPVAVCRWTPSSCATRCEQQARGIKVNHYSTKSGTDPETYPLQSECQHCLRKLRRTFTPATAMLPMHTKQQCSTPCCVACMLVARSAVGMHCSNGYVVGRLLQESWTLLTTATAAAAAQQACWRISSRLPSTPRSLSFKLPECCTLIITTPCSSMSHMPPVPAVCVLLLLLQRHAKKHNVVAKKN